MATGRLTCMILTNMTNDTLYVVEETQTHYAIHDDPEGKYAQCLTCAKVRLVLEPGESDWYVGCEDWHVPRLPACLFREDTGFTLQKLKGGR